MIRSRGSHRDATDGIEKSLHTRQLSRSIEQQRTPRTDPDLLAARSSDFATSGAARGMPVRRSAFTWRKQWSAQIARSGLEEENAGGSEAASLIDRVTGVRLLMPVFGVPMLSPDSVTVEVAISSRWGKP
jgi:hypothetical protein